MTPHDPRTGIPVEDSPGRGPYELQLFVSGNTRHSAKAIVNIRRLCDAHLKGRYSLEVVDLGLSPDRAASEEIIVLPTLVRHSPPPRRNFIGDLSDTARLMKGLDLMDEL
ncbi:MAG: circadian clock KaiB family protein [Flavobacteriales bacterium]